MGGSAGPLRSDHLFYMCQNHLFYMCQNISLIDNIFTNEPLNQSISGLFLNDISDHLPIFAIISGYEQIFHRNKYFTFHSINQQNLIKFMSEIENVNWAELPGYNDPSLAYGNFLKKYTAIYNRCFPLKKVKAKGYTLYKL